MANATFHNFTEEAFTGHWNGKAKTFKPGEKVYMPAYLAEHFAKHLTNRELIKANKEAYTSPKKPQDVPQFMEVFNKAFIRDVISEGQDELEAEIASARTTAPSMNIEVEKPARITGPANIQDEEPEHTGPGSKPQIIEVPGADDDDESNFNDPANNGAQA